MHLQRPVGERDVPSLRTQWTTKTHTTTAGCNHMGCTTTGEGRCNHRSVQPQGRATTYVYGTGGLFPFFIFQPIQGMEKIHISKYDFTSTLKEHRAVCIIGRRGSGKSIAILDIMHQLHTRFDFGMAMTVTAPTAASFRQYMPSCCVFHEFDLDRIQALIDEQEALLQQNNKQNVFVILDDVGFDQKSLNLRTTHCLLMNGRHYRITLIAAVQECYAFRPEMRSQLDVIVCLKDNAIRNKKKLHDSFFGMLEFAQFTQAFDAFTNDHGALVVDQTVQSNTVSDSIFYFSARVVLPRFCMVNATFIKLWNEMKYSDEQVLANRSTKQASKHTQRNEFTRG